MTCARLQHPLICAGMQHTLTCAGMQHPFTYAGIQPILSCAGIEPPLTCAGMQHPLTCAGLLDPLTCAATQRTTQQCEPGLRPGTTGLAKYLQPPGTGFQRNGEACITADASLYKRPLHDGAWQMTSRPRLCHMFVRQWVLCVLGGAPERTTGRWMANDAASLKRLPCVPVYIKGVVRRVV